MIPRPPYTVFSLLQGLGILALVPLAVSLVKRQPPPVPSSDGPTAPLLERAALQDGALEQLVSPEMGLMRFDYYGNVRRVERLRGDQLRSALPEIRAALNSDRQNWMTAEPLSCWKLECTYNPGEAGHYSGRYIFERVGNRLVLSSIVRLEPGPLNSEPRFLY
jgi:hypothetical protein